ncbi:MAG: autotransporter domain-containing protein [Parachlamydiaceae bacterium]
MVRSFLKLLACTLCVLPLEASEYTWTGATDNNLQTSDNWSPSAPPQPTPGIGDVAIFSTGIGGATQPTLSSGATFALYRASVESPGTYEFFVNNSSTLTFGVTGDVSLFPSGVDYLTGTSLYPLFFIKESSTLNFLGRSNASIGTSSASVSYTIGLFNEGYVNFKDNSTAGSAIINVGDPTAFLNGPGLLNFLNGSTAGSSFIYVGDHYGVSSLHFYGDSSTVFSDAGTANIVIGSLLGASKDNDGTIIFHDFSSARNATISVGDPRNLSQLLFMDSSTADHAVITLGSIQYNNKASALFQNSATAAFAQFNVTNESSLQFNAGSSGGECSVILTHSGMLNFPDPGLYSIGSLSGDSTTSVNLTSASLTINYNGDTPVEMAGQISDSGTGGSLTKTGSGTLILSGLNNYTGLTTVQEGTLSLNGQLTGNVLLTNGVLRGSGIIGGDVSTTGGTVSPGNSIGTLYISGNYIQNHATTYLVQLDQNSSGLLDVTGSVTLNNNPLEVILVGGPLDFNHPYLILQAGENITGSFAQPVIDFSQNGINDNLLEATVFYDTDPRVFLTLKTNLQNGAVTKNQRHVAEQLDSIDHASTCENLLINALIGDTLDLGHGFDALSGEPYANLFYVAEINTLHCIQNLYNPLRPFIAAMPNCCCENTGSFWLEANGGRSFLSNSHEAAGLHMDSYELSLGGHSYFTDEWMLGAACFYEHDHIHFNLDASGSNNMILGSVYGLFRPSFGYILADLIGGFSVNTVKRTIAIGDFQETAKSFPKTSQITFYGEGGVDFRIESILLQPFIGIEASYYHRGFIHEHGADCADLVISEKSYENISSRLGVHATCYSEQMNTVFGLDASWLYRFTAPQNSINAQFKSFGNLFTIEGVSWGRNCVEGSVFLDTTLVDSWKFSARFSGQKWENAVTCNLLISLENSW